LKTNFKSQFIWKPIPGQCKSCRDISFISHHDTISCSGSKPKGTRWDPPRLRRYGRILIGGCLRKDPGTSIMIKQFKESKLTREQKRENEIKENKRLVEEREISRKNMETLLRRDNTGKATKTLSGKTDKVIEQLTKKEV